MGAGTQGRWRGLSVPVFAGSLTVSACALVAGLCAGHWSAPLGAAIGLGVAVAGSAWQARRRARPVEQLRESMRRIAAGELRARIRARGDRELGSLGIELGAMARRLERRGRETTQRTRQLRRQASETKTARDASAREGHRQRERLAELRRDARGSVIAILGYADLLLESESERGQRHYWIQSIRRRGTALLGRIEVEDERARMDPTHPTGTLRPQEDPACRSTPSASTPALASADARGVREIAGDA